MSSPAINVGDVRRLTGTFTDPLNSDAAIDPTVVKLTVRHGDGTTATYVYGTDAIVVKDSTGVYHADVELTVVGAFAYRWWSTGTGQASEGAICTVLKNVTD